MVLTIPTLPVRAGSRPADGGGDQTPPAKVDLVYPRGSTTTDSRDALPLALLKLALEETGTPYTLRPSAEVVEQSRAMADLEAGRGINILWAGQSAELEDRLLPVRVPLTRGLLGFRVLLIRRDHQPAFDAVHSLRDLSHLVGGQAFGWPDTALLRAAGLTITINRYDPLFNQLAAGHIDYFPRGVTEAAGELALRGGDALTIERHLLLVYPFDMFFFTRRSDARLATLIEHGLKLAYADGRFLAVFNADPAVRQAQALLAQGGRLRLTLPNPGLTDADKAIPPLYWMDGRAGS